MRSHHPGVHFEQHLARNEGVPCPCQERTAVRMAIASPDKEQWGGKPCATVRRWSGPRPAFAPCASRVYVCRRTGSPYWGSQKERLATPNAANTRPAWRYAKRWTMPLRKRRICNETASWKPSQPRATIRRSHGVRHTHARIHRVTPQCRGVRSRPGTVEQRLLGGKVTLNERRELHAVAGWLSGLPAEVSLAPGDEAQTHCATALALANEVGHAQLAGSAAMVRCCTHKARANARLGDRETTELALEAAEHAWNVLAEPLEQASITGIEALDICSRRPTLTATRRIEELLAVLRPFTEPCVVERRERWRWIST